MKRCSRVAEQLDGLDHIVLAVADLDAAAREWAACGFTISPRGQHSDYLGTANHTVMFEDDYIELLGVLKSTEFNQPTRDFLAAEDGLERLAMRSRDTVAAVTILRSEGRQIEGPFEFSRPVEVRGGSNAVAAFHIFQWPTEASVEGARLFACQHLTPDTVWLPDLVRHANTARSLLRIERLCAAPEAAARDHAAVIGAETIAIEGGWSIPAAGRGAAVDYLAPDTFAARWGASMPDAPACGVVIRVDDLSAASRFAAVAPDATGYRAVARLPGAFVAFVA